MRFISPQQSQLDPIKPKLFRVEFRVLKIFKPGIEKMADLTETFIKKLKPQDKPFKVPDGGSLYLFIAPTGTKVFRYRYEIGGKEKLLTIGPWPDITLADARKIRDQAKQKKKEGKDPSAEKKNHTLTVQDDSKNTFEVLAREWFGLQKGQWVPRHADDVISSLEQEVFPYLGRSPIKDISIPAVMEVLRRIEARKAIETARRVRQRMSAVFVYAISTGRAQADPAGAMKTAMAPLMKGRQPAITDIDAVRAMLRKCEAEDAHPVTKLALRILALTAVRPGTLITTPWPEWFGVDKTPVWQIPAARMKLRLYHKNDEKRDHIVPLSKQAVDAIAVLFTISGRGPLAFPNLRTAHKPMSENAIGYLLNRAGFHGRHVPHGFRATFSTIMNERYPSDKQVIDLMLAHSPKDRVEAAYNRALHLPRRTELAQIWADTLLDGFPSADEIIHGKRRHYDAPFEGAS